VAERTAGRWIGSTSGKMEASRSSASGSGEGSEPRGPAIHAARATEPPGSSDERTIVDAVLAGDRDAYRQLVERESASIVRTCHRILGDLHEAEDAAQEAFVTAYRSLASWRGEGPFGAWLTRIAVRIALRQADRRQTVAWIDPRGTAGGPADGDRSGASSALDAQAAAAAPRTDPALLTVRGERAAELRHAVAGLPEPYREIVTLRFFGDLSLEEIAGQTDRPLGTVKTQLRRGLLRLRSSVEPGGAA
jgi:RNA polymerase sigma-70 factor (ECF subfamily)